MKLLIISLLFSFSALADVTASIKNTITSSSKTLDGKIVVLDSAGLVSRYGVDGIVDGRFSSKVYTNFKPSMLAVQGEKTIVAGFSASGFGFLRLNLNGSLDTTFGTKGFVSTDFSGLNNEFINDLKVLQDGRIVAVGYGKNSRSGLYNMIVARYTKNGLVDTTFNRTGMFTYASQSLAKSVTIQSDGKLLIGGQINFKASLTRLSSNGTLDNSFGGGMRVSVKDGIVNDVKEKDGKIVAVGHIIVPSVGYRIALSKFNLDGSSDKSFNSIGYKEMAVGVSTCSANNVMIEDNGDITVTGYSTLGLGTVKSPRYSNATAIKLTSFGDVERVLVYDYKNYSSFNSLDADLIVGYILNMKGNVTMVIKEELR